MPFPAPPEDPSEETKPGFGRVPPPEGRPDFDPSNSPLVRGGTPNAPEPEPADARFRGLLEPPHQVGRPRVTVRVRREGWVARRTAARDRFGTISRTRPSSESRVLGGLQRRGSLLERSKHNAARPRFTMRGRGRY